MTETFEDDVRDRAMSLANFMLWSFNLVTVTAFPPLMDSVGPKWVFFMFGCVGVGCVLFIWLMVKETKGMQMGSPHSQDLEKLESPIRSHDVDSHRAI